MRRVRHVLLILIGRSRADIAIEEFLMAFEKSEASLATLQATAAAVVAEVQSLQAAAANQVDVAAIDTDLSAKIDAVNATLAGTQPPAA